MARRFYWDADRLRYVYSNGAVVAPGSVHKALDNALSHASGRVRRASVDLKEGRISLRDWEKTMRQSIKETQVYSATLARGGRAAMTKRDYGLTGPMVREQYAYLRKFTAQIESGAVKLDGRFLRRAELYTEAGWKTYSAFDELNHRERGFDEEKNVLDPRAEHCDGCKLVTSYGWVQMGTLRPIGQRPCKNRDRCHLIYRRSEAARANPPAPRSQTDINQRIDALPGIPEHLRAVRKRDEVQIESVFSKKPVSFLVGYSDDLLTPKTVRRLRLSELTPSQDFIPREGLRAYIDGTPLSKGLPVVVEFEGRTIVLEGHTRIGAAIMRGEEDLAIHVLRIEGAGRNIHVVGLADGNAAIAEMIEEVVERKATQEALLKNRGIDPAVKERLDGVVKIVHEPPRMPDGWQVTGEVRYGEQIVFGNVSRVPHFQIEAPNGEIFWVNGQGNAAAKEYAVRMKKLGYKRVGLGEKSATLAKKAEEGIAKKVVEPVLPKFSGEAEGFWRTNWIAAGQNEALAAPFMQAFDAAKTAGATTLEALRVAKEAIGLLKFEAGASFQSRIVLESMDPAILNQIQRIKGAEKTFRKAYDLAKAKGKSETDSIIEAITKALEPPKPKKAVGATLSPEALRDKLAAEFQRLATPGKTGFKGSSPREWAQEMVEVVHQAMAPHAGIAFKPPQVFLDAVGSNPNFVAWFQPGHRTAHYGRDLTRTLESMASAIRYNRPLDSEMTSALRTVIHELNHSLSPVGWRDGWGYAVETGRILEEAMVEWKARKLTHTVVGNGLADSSGVQFTERTLRNVSGSYIREVSSIINYERVFGEGAVDKLWKMTKYADRTKEFVKNSRSFLSKAVQASDMNPALKKRYKAAIDRLSEQDLVEGFGSLDTSSTGYTIQRIKEGTLSGPFLNNQLLNSIPSLGSLL